MKTLEFGKKYMVTMRSWKWFKVLWMGIAWGNMEDGWMGLKHTSQNVTYFAGICFKGLGYPNIKTHAKLPTKLDMFWWVVGFKVQVLRLMFRGARFLTSWNKHQAGIETRHVLCQFALGPMLSMCGNPHRATLKQTTHLRLVIEKTSGHQKMCSLKWLQNCHG
jgi:hypothetical protein